MDSLLNKMIFLRGACFAGFLLCGILDFFRHKRKFFGHEREMKVRICRKRAGKPHPSQSIWKDAACHIIMDFAERRREAPNKNKKWGIQMMEQRKIRVVIGDRDLFYSQRLKYSLERRGSLNVVGMTDNGPELLEMIGTQRPDVVLMDVLLGERDGFWVLERIKDSGSMCIMVSAIDNDVLVRRAITLGAAYYMAKPIQGDLLLERMEQLLDLQGERQELLKSQKITEPLRPVVKSDPWEGLEAEISVCLSRMGISAGLKGYHFVRQAVLMAVEDQEVLTGITKGLYPDIAKMYKTTASKVERAIRHAIAAAWKGNGQQVYFEISGCLMTEKPTNGQFIAMMSEYFRRKNRAAISKIG